MTITDYHCPPRLHRTRNVNGFSAQLSRTPNPAQASTYALALHLFPRMCMRAFNTVSFPAFTCSLL